MPEVLRVDHLGSLLRPPALRDATMTVDLMTQLLGYIVVDEMVKLTLKVASEGRAPRVPYHFGDFLPGGARANELGPIARILAAGGKPGDTSGGGVVAR